MRQTIFAAAVAAAMGLAPQASFAQLDVARESYRTRNFDAALAQVEVALQADPKDHAALYIRGSARVEKGLETGDADLVRAGVADAREAIGIEGSGLANYYLPYLYGMTSLSAAEDDPQHAQTSVAVAKQVIDRGGLLPDEEANLRYQQGMAYLELEQDDEAIVALREAVRNMPKHVAAQALLADVYAANNRPAEAEAVYAAALQAMPESGLIYNNRGMFRQSGGDLDGAVADFAKALQIDPIFYQAATNLGFAHMQAGRTREAVAAFDQSLKINPQQPGAVSLRGTTRLNAGDVRSAVADYREVLKMDPRNGAAHADLGFAYFFVNQYAAAAQSFANARSVDPKMVFLAPWQYFALTQAGKSDEAAKLVPASKEQWHQKLTLFLAGKMGGKEMMDGVEKTDQDVRTMQLTEAYYFVGLRSIAAGQKAQAKPYLERAASSKARNLSANRGAKFALRSIQATR